jgi:hypothetical protein
LNTKGFHPCSVLIADESEHTPPVILAKAGTSGNIISQQHFRDPPEVPAFAGMTMFFEYFGPKTGISTKVFLDLQLNQIFLKYRAVLRALWLLQLTDHPARHDADSALSFQL